MLKCFKKHLKNKPLPNISLVAYSLELCIFMDLKFETSNWAMPSINDYDNVDSTILDGIKATRN